MPQFVSSDHIAGPIPDPVAHIAGVMAGYPEPWALCGGWAVDAWLGRTSREHGDVDISVFVQDQVAVSDHLRDWQLLAHDPVWSPGGSDEWWDGRRALNAGTHIHARPPGRSGEMPKDGIAKAEDGFSIEFYLDDRSGEDWVLSRDPLITVPLQGSVRESGWGVPTAVPEVLLLFKARDLRRQDKLDFSTLLPHLAEEQRTWLREAIRRLGHPWLRELMTDGAPSTAAL